MCIRRLVQGARTEVWRAGCVVHACIARAHRAASTRVLMCTLKQASVDMGVGVACKLRGAAHVGESRKGISMMFCLRGVGGHGGAGAGTARTDVAF